MKIAFLLIIILISSNSFSKSLNIMTFNVWLVKKLGISISSILEEERLPLIAKHIKDANPDVVAIQEIWSFSLRDKLINKLSAKYPHTYFRKFHVGMGDGMILLSISFIIFSSSSEQSTYSAISFALFWCNTFNSNERAGAFFL